MRPFRPMLLEYRRLEPKYPNRAGRGAGVGDGGWKAA